ncbi:MAG: 50S ribosomal protein L9 [Geodermatophilaceae bacterium]|nr:50S ribosomal protein L9 [Geodermatophilaceae bacterium]
MRLILTQEVGGLGSPGDVVEVKDGYGRNYLVPRGFAMKATKGAEKQIETLQRTRAAREVRSLEEARSLAGQLGALSVTLKARAGDSGRLFGSVTTTDIVEAVQAAGGPELDRRRVELHGSIKSTGKHMVTVRIHPEVAAEVSLDVIAG